MLPSLSLRVWRRLGSCAEVPPLDDAVAVDALLSCGFEVQFLRQLRPSHGLPE